MNPYIPEPNEPPRNVQEKLRISEIETEGLKEREISCPVCDFRIYGVFEDCVGHCRIWCRKCKKSYVINLAYFRRQKMQRMLRYAYCFRTRQHR